jgi:hypothetical protein
MPQSGYTSELPNDVLLDTGLLYVNSTIVGVSRGGLTFDPGIETRNIPYDGQKAPTKLLDRIIKRTPQITGTMLEADETQLRIFETGGATPNVTPKGQGTLFASGDYLTNVDLVFNRGDGGTVTIRFASALCTEYQIVGQVDSEAEVAVTFEARLVHGATPDESSVPYTITVA